MTSKLRSFKSRSFVVGVMALTSFAAFSGVASASGTAPTFDVSTLSPAMYALGTVVLGGLGAILAVTLGIKAPFVLVRICLNAIKKLFGRAQPQAG